MELDGTVETCTAKSNANGMKGEASGSMMLQIHRTSPASEQETSPASACSLQRATEQPLTEEGFQEITKSCCYEDMKAFTRRLIDDMGLKVCDEGGLSGIAPFYSCPLSPVTLVGLKDDLSKAMPAGNSKCHWLEQRYATCTEPALECSVTAQKPPPAPTPVSSGFFGFTAGNPAEMLRSSKAIDVMTNELALALGLSTSYINVIIGSGTLDGEEVASSFVVIPASQAFYSRGGVARTCKVFAVYSIQEPASKKSSITTPAPSLDEQDIVEKLKHLDIASLSRRLSQDLDDVDKPVGKVDVVEETVCEKTSLKCTHVVIKEEA